MIRTKDIDRALRERAELVIPHGMYGHQSVALLPKNYPQFFDHGKGAHLWDVDGNRYLDFMCAYGPNLFGYAHEGIDASFCARLAQSDCMTGPGAVMVELAEAMTSMVSHADWAMFCKNGTDATTMAMMTARQYSGKKTIALARGAYHGSAPWCTPLKNGTTTEDRANQIFYDYNDVDSLETCIKAAGNDLAAIFASPIKHDVFVDQAMPNAEYAHRARELCDEHGALLIVDDVRAGFRLARDSSWSLVDVKPDLSTWGKAIANGHPISALLGSDIARKAAASIYATGSFWFSTAPMAAALTTLSMIRTSDYLENMQLLGERLRKGLNELAHRHGFGLRQTGPAQLPLIMFADDSTGHKGYFWNNSLVKRGVYFHPWHNMFLCAVMTPEDIDFTLNAADDAFIDLKNSIPSLMNGRGFPDFSSL